MSRLAVQVFLLFCMTASSLWSESVAAGPKQMVEVQIPASVAQARGFDIEQTRHRDLVRTALDKSKERQDVKHELEQLSVAIQDAQGTEKGFLKSRLAYAKYYSGDSISALYDFKDIVDGVVPAEKKEVVDARVRIGYLHVRHKNYADAYEAFLPMATGKVEGIDALTATDAAMRIGFIQRKLGASDEAINSWRQISEKSSLKDDADYAKLLVAGTQWESGKGDYNPFLNIEQRVYYFQESINTCQELMRDPSVRNEIKIIAELIHMEDYFFLGQYDKATELAEAFLMKWEPEEEKTNVRDLRGATFFIDNYPRRQLITCQMWLAMCYYKVGRYSDCIQVARMIRDGRWSENDPYRNFNVWGYSLLYEAMAQETLGNTMEGDRLRAEAREKYARWYNAVAPAEAAKDVRLLIEASDEF